MRPLHFITNYASFGILAISGLLANWLVDLFYSPAVLGMFNTFMAWYIVISQIVALGQQLTVQNFIPRYIDDVRSQCKIITSASLITVAVGTSCAFFLVCLSFYLESMRTSLLWLAGIAVIAGVNKVFIFSIAAHGKYHLFALSQTVRPILLLTGVFLCGYLQLDAEILFGSFFLGELGVFFCGLRFNQSYFSFGAIRRADLVEPIKYGSKSAVGLGVAELNTRVDILALSILASAQQVATFSISLIFFEGYYQLLMVIRNLVSRPITSMSHNSNHTDLKRFFRKTILMTYACFVPIGAIVIFLAPLVVSIFPNASSYEESFKYALLIILILMALSGFLVFENIYSILNRPGIYSITKIWTLIINVAAQFILYYRFGLWGTAYATALSFGAMALFNFSGILYAIRTADIGTSQKQGA